MLNCAGDAGDAGGGLPENHKSPQITADPITPQVCRYVTLWNVSVLKTTIETRPLLYRECNPGTRKPG